MGPELRRAWEESARQFAMPSPPWTLPRRTVLEIGSGMGDSLLATAARAELAIGVDVHVRGLAATVRAARTARIGNIRLVEGDAVEVLRDLVPPSSLGEVHVWFPDPWPKARHRKRRLIRPPVAALIADRLRPGGVLMLATDIGDYALAMSETLRAVPILEPLGPEGRVPRPDWRPVTRYERVALQQGRTPVELAFARR